MPSNRLSTTFAALADPTWRAILVRLASGKASVMELAAPFKMSLPSISKHLKVLEGAVDWLEHYRPFWEQGFGRPDQYLRKVQRKEKKHGRQK